MRNLPVAFYRPKGTTPGPVLPVPRHFWDFASTGSEPDQISTVAMNENSLACPLTATGAPDGGPFRTTGASVSSGFVSASNISADFTAGVTYAGWTRVNGGVTNVWPMGHGPTVQRSQLLCVNASGTFRAMVDVVDFSETPDGKSDGLWHSWSISNNKVDGDDTDAESRLYVDGVDAGLISIERGWRAVDALLYLHVRWDGVAGSFTGDICSAGIWDVPFTADQHVLWHNGGTNFRGSNLPT